MTLLTHRDDRIGRHLLLGFVGTEPAQAAALIRSLHPAGLILLPHNVVDRSQIRALTAGLQDIASSIGLPPLLVATDQEGGAVRRLAQKHGFEDLPSAMTVGRSDEADAVRLMASAAAADLHAAGVNMNFAPVVDLASDPRNEVIGSRSYGSNPTSVAAAGRVVIATLQEHGIAAVAKHFPGHGATAVDSHLALPVLDATTESMEMQDLVPFKAAIEADVAAIMTAHVVTPFDPSQPATFSPKVMTALLRNSLGFDGVLISDSLEMRAVAAAGLSTGEAAIRAIHAGSDLLIFDGDLGQIDLAVRALHEAIESSRLSDARLAQSADRMHALLARIDRRSAPQGSESDIGPADVLRVAERGTTVADPAGRLGSLAARVTILPLAAGARFAERTGFALTIPAPANGPAADPDEARVLVVDEPDDLDAYRDAERELIVVLGGARLPEHDVSAGVPVILAHDLPPSLWVAIGRRIQRSPDGSTEVGK